MKKILIGVFILLPLFIWAQQNLYFIKLAKKEIATFNDGIILLHLFYNEPSENATFLENILWAAEKKLFQVSIPIKQNEINPLLTRREFAYWICKIFNTKGGLLNNKFINKYSAYRLCVNLGLTLAGRGEYDGMSGQELIDTFSYLDYYVRYKKILTNEGSLELIDDGYYNIPQWRIKFTQEMEELQKKKKKINEIKKKIKIKKKKLQLKKDQDQEVEIEKTLEE